jgi:SAM-dependent methyltransferase
MPYRELTYESRFFIKRLLHKRRFQEAIELLALEGSDVLLDYGCGDAHLLELCLPASSAEHLFGFEPSDVMYEEAASVVAGKNIKLFKRIEEMTWQFTKISCLETCEHLTDEELKTLFRNIKTLLRPGGQLLVSVPVEIGPPAMFKNLFRFLKNRKHDNLTLNNYLKAILGLPIARNTQQQLGNVRYIYSHIGFDHRTFERQLREHFTIVRRHCSPFNWAGPMFNNTIYYVCRRNEASPHKLL